MIFGYQSQLQQNFLLNLKNAPFSKSVAAHDLSIGQGLVECNYGCPLVNLVLTVPKG